MAKITVIGSFVMDNVALMKRYPEAGESIIGESIQLFPGGKGANQCVAIARLGGDVEMVGMLGDDANGKIFRQILQNENIKNDNVFVCNKPTGIAQVQINMEGQNRICVIPSANFEFGMNELEKIDTLLRETSLVVLQLEMQYEIIEEIIRRCKKYGTKIILNPAPAHKIKKDIIGLVDYLTPNETELSILTDIPTNTHDGIIKAGKKLLSYGVKTLIATLGNKGAMIMEENNVQFVPAYKVKAVDTVGAGDSFNGALAVALCEGKSIYDAVKFANAMGALTVQVKGAIPSLHTRDELEEFINRE